MPSERLNKLIEDARKKHPFYSSTKEERKRMIDEFFESAKRLNITKEDIEWFLRDRCGYGEDVDVPQR